MASRREPSWNRRELLRYLTLAGPATVLGLKSGPAAAEPPPESTRIRLHEAPITCFAPLGVAEGLLKAEGFTEVQYVKAGIIKTNPKKIIAQGTDWRFIVDLKRELKG